MPEKLWDLHTPQNLHSMELSLLDAAGRVLDTAWTTRFGFRELWFDGRDILLNGTRIHLRAVPFDNAQLGLADLEAGQCNVRVYGDGVFRVRHVDLRIGGGDGFVGGLLYIHAPVTHQRRDLVRNRRADEVLAVASRRDCAAVVRRVRSRTDDR